MNKSWYDTTCIMDKIELEVADVDIPRQLDMCAIIWKLLELKNAFDIILRYIEI